MKALRDEGVFCFKVHGSEFMTAGLPDIIACVDGYFVGFETKMPGKEKNLSPRQRHVHTEIRAALGLVYVVSSMSQAIDALSDIRESS